MSIFCLVHGSTQNASCWDLLIPPLQKHGHETVRMTLPADEPDASATRYAKVIAEAIPATRDDVIVVAHSASGLYLPLVPTYRPVRRLVYLAAVLPQIGKSLLEQFKADNTMINPNWLGKDPTKDPQAARDFLFHDCSPQTTEWALATTMRLLFARAAVFEICPLTAWPSVPSSYLNCTEDRTIQPDWFRRAARERLGVEPIDFPAGHCPYLSRPDQLADLLSTLA